MIAHVTVWNKYSKAVLDFNLPLTGKDTVSFSMRDIMNGKLSLEPARSTTRRSTPTIRAASEPRQAERRTRRTSARNQTQFIRFSHPDADPRSERTSSASISQYYATADAFGPRFRPKVWDSLDESGDITTFTDVDGRATSSTSTTRSAAGPTARHSVFKDDLSGYLTIDVVNYCTNFFPDQADFYDKDAIATIGWGTTYTPNVLIGDVFYVDTAANGGNISGDPAVAARVRRASSPSRPRRRPSSASSSPRRRPRSASRRPPLRRSAARRSSRPTLRRSSSLATAASPSATTTRSAYLADSASGVQSWITVWRSDFYQGTAVNLCGWANPATNKGASGSGLYDAAHQVGVLTYDGDENLFGGVGIPPGPSGQQPGTQSSTYIFLESQRINLLTATDWNPAGFKFGWVDLTLRGATLTGTAANTGLYNMGWVGVHAHGPRRVPQRRPCGFQPQRSVPVLAGDLHRSRRPAINS